MTFRQFANIALVFLWCTCVLVGCSDRALGVPQTAEESDAAVAQDLTSSGSCSVMLHGVNLQKTAGCVLVESVTKMTATLLFPCAGGTAEVAFAESDRFTGTVIDGQVDLSMTRPFGWSDGCDWESHQTITGDLRTHQLHFEYQENPVAGQTNCATACTGTADVTVM